MKEIATKGIILAAFEDAVGKRENVRMASIVHIEVAYDAIALDFLLLAAKHRDIRSTEA